MGSGSWIERSRERPRPRLHRLSRTFQADITGSQTAAGQHLYNRHSPHDHKAISLTNPSSPNHAFGFQSSHNGLTQSYLRPKHYLKQPISTHPPNTNPSTTRQHKPKMSFSSSYSTHSSESSLSNPGYDDGTSSGVLCRDFAIQQSPKRKTKSDKVKDLFQREKLAREGRYVSVYYQKGGRLRTG